MTGAADDSPPPAPGSASAPGGMADLRSSVVRNTVAQVVGRGLVAVLRLLVAAIIVRLFGANTFGEYALVFGLLSFAEWLVDFGTTEVFVRDICREPTREQPLLRILTALKLFQVPLAVALLAAVMLALRYPEGIIRAGLIGGTSLVFFAGVLLFRVVFKAHLTIEREVMAELVSVLALIPAVALTGRYGGGLAALFACHVASRALFFLLCFALGRRRFVPSTRGVTAAELRSAISASVAIGTIGLLVVVYEILDILLLSKLATTEALAYYSGAQRMVWPIMLALGAVGGTLYPVAARFWPNDRERFDRACQRGLDTVLLLAGVALSSTVAGAEFWLGLLGPDLAAGAPALRLLSVLVFFKAISSTLGPVLYVVHAQQRTLQFIFVAVIMKAAVIAALASRYGYLGVAVGALIVELVFSVAPTLYLLRRQGGLRLRWSAPLKVALATAGAATAAVLALPAGGIATALLAPALYVPLTFLLGAVRVADVRLLLDGRAS